MNTQQKIDAIIEKRYSNYKPKAYRHLKTVHQMIREIQVPYTKWQIVKSFFGFGLPIKKIINNDEGFLVFLEKLEVELPKEKYVLPDDIREMFEKHGVSTSTIK